MATIISVPNETNASYTRTTRDGRKLTYEMSVLQQPQRARACGSGAKSSADRRPVDPPPVVELKIFEGENRKDITFQHNANFFLYTTLESARPIATARGANTVSGPHPVLTGMPVAGMAYLDRPTQAGYFIFPDLSVRHEGKFRLSFNLYEELKETKDLDPEGALPPTPAHEASRMLRTNPTAAVQFRLEVKSHPFTVYSAKKFPGLTESTELSRLVAEQGCRVRIRRDVRMRRRETTKVGKEMEGYSDEEQTGYTGPTVSVTAADRYATPDSYHHERAPQAAANPPAPLDRRPSHHEPSAYYGAQQHPPPLPPQQPSYAPPPPGPAAGYAPSPYASAPAPPPAPSYASGPSPYAPPPLNTSYPYPPPVATHHRPSSSSGSNYAYPPRPNYTPTRTSAYDNDYSRPRAGSSAHFNTLVVDKDYTAGGAILPPLKTFDAPPPPLPTAGKRSYGGTFDDGHGNGLRNGARPEAVGQDYPQIECDDGTVVGENELPDYKTLTYRRADGSRQHKKIPTVYP